MTRIWRVNWCFPRSEGMRVDSVSISEGHTSSSPFLLANILAVPQPVRLFPSTNGWMKTMLAV